MASRLWPVILEQLSIQKAGISQFFSSFKIAEYDDGS
jgi:hypothetical protein